MKLISIIVLAATPFLASCGGTKTRWVNIQCGGMPVLQEEAEPIVAEVVIDLDEITDNKLPCMVEIYEK